MIARDITRDCERILALAVALLALGLATIARADCDPGELVRARIEQQDPGAWSQLGVRMKAEPQARGYRLTLDTERDGIQGTRVFEAASCAELADAATLLLTLMLDEAREAVPSPPPPPPPPATRPPPPAAGRRAYATVQAAALGELGTLPRAGAGAQLAAGVALRRARIELSGLWLPDVRSARGNEGARVAIGLWAARLGYCHRLVGRRVALFGCLGLELGRVRGKGLDLNQQRDRAYLWSAGYAGLRGSLMLGRGVALLLEPGLAVPFERRRFVSIDATGGPDEALHTPAPVSGRLAIALEASF